MKTIRTNKTLNILPIIAVLFWAGCEDLDFPDPNDPLEEAFTIQSLVTGAESVMRQDLGIYLRDLLVVGREAYYLEPADPRYTGELLIGPIDPGGFLCNRPWQAAYKVIANCVTLMDHDSADAGAKGVAQTLHAYSLMRLVYLWDESGARLNYDSDISAPVSSKAKVLVEIESLLDTGYSDLQSADSSFSFSLSSGFSDFDTPATFAWFNRGLRARVAVHQNDWSAAQTALDSCGSWATSSDHDEGIYHVFSTAANDLDNQMYEAADGEYVKLMIHPSHITDADSGDSRVTDNTYIRSEVITYDELESFIAPTFYSSSYDPVPIMRAVELQLLQAEVHIGNSDYTAAEAIMNEIRAAAGLAGYTETNAGNAVDRVLHEKRYSLFLEGHRLVDMRHYGMTDQLPLDRPDRGDTIVTFPIPEAETPG